MKYKSASLFPTTLITTVCPQGTGTPWETFPYFKPNPFLTFTLSHLECSFALTHPM